MGLAIILLAYFIGIPLGIILWKIALTGININDYRGNQKWKEKRKQFLE